MRPGQVAQARQHQQRDHNKDPYRRANPQVFAQQLHRHADQQKAITEDLYDQLREEAGQRVDVAVNAFDHFAGRILLVEREIEVQAVAQQVIAQGVGRAPTYTLG